MRFWPRRPGKPHGVHSLGLADPAHPARKRIDVASVIADRRLEIGQADESTTLRTDSKSMADLIGVLDIALIDAPDDPDLLAARAAAHTLAQEPEFARRDIDHVLRIDEHHLEANMLKLYGNRWDSLLFLPGWSGAATRVHPVMAQRANRGDALHCVRHKLQVALVLLLIADPEDYRQPPLRWRWEVLYGDTPYGPIGSHYALFDIGGKIRRQECFLAPSTQRNPPSMPPSQMLGRLASARICFLVVADASGKVIHNLEYVLPMETRRTLSRLAEALVKASGTDAQTIRNASEWQMQHIDLDSVTFPGG